MRGREKSDDLVADADRGCNDNSTEAQPAPVSDFKRLSRYDRVNCIPNEEHA